MSASVSTHDREFAALGALRTWPVPGVRPGAWARAAMRRLAAAMRARRLARRADAAFGDAYEALHRLDPRVLVDIGLRPEQVTAFSKSAMLRPAHERPAPRRAS